ncbi:MAG: DUF2147 domain-containing protein [Bacteroidales bacterium]|nr:DUF2147 domain-containing protein [Bacteroidales bacterium]
MKLASFATLFVAFMIMPLFSLQAQDIKANDIVGLWLTQDKDSHVEIYKEGDKYFGKIVWLKDPNDDKTGKPKLDDKNPDPALQSRPVLGLNLLKDFVFDDDEWNDGKIYDPKSGKTYSCYMEFPDSDNKNRLKIRGYVGISLLGRTVYWTRVQK